MPCLHSIENHYRLPEFKVDGMGTEQDMGKRTSQNRMDHAPCFYYHFGLKGSIEVELWRFVVL